MKINEKAQSIFNRIGDGHKSAVRRPWDMRIDRSLRKLIEYANNNGDCIIPRSNGEGYYRPIPGDKIDDLEFRSYMQKEHSRILSLTLKEISMNIAYESRRYYE